MSRIWQTIRSYFWWTHERGNLHYDVMVTIILLFIFVGPRFIDFKDKPQERNPNNAGVTIHQDTQDEFSYQVEVSALKLAPGADLGDALKRWVEPFLGEVRLKGYTPVTDAHGQVISYTVHVQKL